MALDNLDTLLNQLENPREFSKRQRDEVRQILLEHAAEVLPELHVRLRRWIDEFSSPEVKDIDERCRAEAEELRARLGTSDQSAFLAQWAELPSVRERETLREREARAMALVELVGEIAQADSIPALKEVLHGPWRNDMTWFTAAAALIRLGDAKGTAYIKERILDPATTPGLRRGCCRKLVELGVTGVFGPDEVFPGDPGQAAALEEEYGGRLRRG